jgi:hypothetical protein
LKAALPPKITSTTNIDEERKTICFVVSDEEVFFSKDRLIQHSPYIASLVQDLDPHKVRRPYF